MRACFPVLYLFLLSPVAMGFDAGSCAWIAVVLFSVSLVRNYTVAAKFIKLVFATLITLIPFLILVRTAVCSRDQTATWDLISRCVETDALSTLSTLFLAVSVLSLAASNEWRGSILPTVNGMGLPRPVRITALLAGVMIGDFKRAVTRAHHAYAARGDASPRFRTRNLRIIPGILANVWASVLSTASQKLEIQWAADAFWHKYIPQHPKHGVHYERSTGYDIVVAVFSTIFAIMAIWPLIYA